MGKYVCGIDIGTTGVKVMIFGLDGTVMSSAYTEYPCTFPRSGWVEQDGEMTWTKTCETSRRAIEESGLDPKEIVAIGLSTQRCTITPIDKDGNALCTSISWQDARSFEEVEEIKQIIGEEEFYKITGKRELQEVLVGIRAAKTAGLPVKLNAVNRKELDPIPMVRYAQEENLPLRFIEMMPVGYGKKYVGRSNEELRETLEAVCGKAECMTNREELSRMGSGPAVYYQFSDLKVPVGFISAIHGKFCDTCNRVRLTAEGYLKLCLCYDEGENLRRVLREGEKENLRTIMEQTIFRKPAAHCFEHPAEMTETHEMVKIGG